MSPEVAPPVQAYDADAQAKIRTLLASEQVPQALELLAAHDPVERSQAIDFEYVSGAVQVIVGNYRGARTRLVRALRLTSGHVDRRVQVRIKLAAILYRLGETPRGERQFRRALADVHAGRATGFEPWLLNGLAHLHMLRGSLRQAAETMERALAAVHEASPGARDTVISLSTNLALFCLEMGQMDRAHRLIRDLLSSGPADQAWRNVNVHLADALHALYTGDYGRCEKALDHAAGEAPEFNLRANVLVRQYRVELRLARGESSAVLPELEALLAEILEKSPHGDHVPMTARLLATALLRVGRAADGLEKAELAGRTARHGDSLEFLASLRVAAECHAALGDRARALTVLGEAWSTIRDTEFEVEKQRLEVVTRALGLVVQSARDTAGPRPATTRPVRRLELRDGRAFLTLDEGLVARIRLAGSSTLPVLIEGETGTGKELVAHLVHELAGPARSLVVVDCAALPESLAEAELFGVARGAFTGAVADRRGLLASADQGTLFLDELPELSLAVQAKLLRVLQDGSYRRIGEDRPRRARIRVIAATNRDVERLVMQGQLKADLFYRLNGFRLQMMPLRERRTEIGPLVEQFASASGLSGVSELAMARLKAHAWPGNVRELEMVIRVAGSKLPPGTLLTAEALEEARLTPSGISTLRDRRHAAERRMLEELLSRHGGNVAAAARAISMSRQGLYKALKRVGLG